ncbi:hypothetical protein DPEC_G00341730 [Dallia pectoralis]|uniref:Uncharacterized protein n=1 Tax=Dallia pectoralis TaxID=75939 RepID=A0ACC2F5I8_DALPE|nr:hypothetical protein DPEC_G00341730 [Dallia pectoralis]
MSHGQKTKRPHRTPAKMSAPDTRETSPQGATSNLPDSLTSTEFLALCSSIEASVAASVRASIADTVRTAATDAIVLHSSSIDVLHATFEGQGSRLNDVESGLSEYSDRLVRLEDNCRLRDKLDDLEFRSRQNNVRILNVRVKMELDDKLTFVSSFLLEVLGPSGVLSSAPKLDRAHRLGRLPDDPTNARPRPLICCLHDFQDRERILRRRDKSQLFFRGGKIFIFPDMISSVSEKQATFLGVKCQLYNGKVRFSLRHPARLHVEYSGERLVFDSAGEAQKWYDSTFNMLTS